MRMATRLVKISEMLFLILYKVLISSLKIPTLKFVVDMAILLKNFFISLINKYYIKINWKLNNSLELTSILGSFIRQAFSYIFQFTKYHTCVILKKNL